MIVTVASGKGGTGKTTVVCALARILEPELGETLSVVDLDVEAPNAALFLKPEIKSTEDAFLAVPRVDEKRCTRCRACAEVCQFQAIAVLGEVIFTSSEMCHACGGCAMVCPEAAISWDRRLLGQVRRGRLGRATYLEGRLRIGEAMSPPLMRQVKSAFDSEQIILVDAPPGTSCPAVAAVKGSDVVVMVTEPTPFGRNDLALALKAFAPLNLPLGVVINRTPSDSLGSALAQTLDLCRDHGAPVWLKIPDDRGVAQAYARGLTLIQARPELEPELRRLWQRILKAAEKKGEGGDA